MTLYLHPNSTRNLMFFSLNLGQSGGTLLTDRIDSLRAAIALTATALPFIEEAWAVLPDRIEAVWSLPEGDTRLEQRWTMVERVFSFCLTETEQAGFAIARPALQHRLDDVVSYAEAVRRCWFAPVRAGLADRPEDWVYSSIHRESPAMQLVA